ncbi:MAG: winged helix-turn-helix transcriptional regulator [Lachnospiraceae bacterium]|jgi:pseudouridine kinase|nr:winged helix-turn-helix transcriptional regulator [Lachnospiraceae bacterium]
MTERERQILGWIQENPMISQQELADKAGIARSSAAVHISNLMKKGVILGKGYIIREEDDIIVIGGVNMDICGTPTNPLVKEDSNPGHVTMSLGGVGRNIAHNLRLLEQPVRLITAFGDDMNASKLQESCLDLGIDISDSLEVAGASTSCYLFITDENGEMRLAVSDMDIYAHMTPEFMAGKLDLINRAGLCVIDTNIPKETIEFLAERVTVPLFADPVSTTKMHKLQKVLGRIHTFKPNRLEAELLTGIHITDESSLKLAAGLLLNTGMKRVFISLGADGVFCAERGHNVLIPAFPAAVRNTTGGGDCFMAGLAYACKKGMDLEESARLALAAGAICAEGEHTINEELSERELFDRAGMHFPGDEPEEDWSME